MNALVTGGTGAVGSYFVPHLAAAGWQVTVITRQPEKARFPGGVPVRFLQGDLDSPEGRAAIERHNASYDAVFHLAASLDYFGAAEALDRTNAGGTELIAALARRCGARRFVHASSIEAMGSHVAAEVPAPLDRLRPVVSTYGASKLAAERVALALNSAGVSACTVRIGNVYGPGRGNFIVESAVALLTRERFYEWHGAYADRYISPVHNADVAAGLLAAAKSDHAGPVLLVGPAATFGEIFRLCADALGVPYEAPRLSAFDRLWLDLRMKRVRRNGGPFDSVAYALAPEAPRIHRGFSMEESARLLGWKPGVALRLGIAETLAWARAEGLLGSYAKA